MPHHALLLTFALAALTAVSFAADKTRPSIYTHAQRENIRRNIERFRWARVQRDAAVRRAKPWLEIDDEALWKLVPEQSLPRSTTVNMSLGCPKCGKAAFKHGPKPYRVDWRKRPWKIQCPECHEVWPKNDFGKYYESGKGPGWIFDPKRADKSLLFNTDHPDPKDPLHQYGVDDGYGFKNETGTYWLVAYYNAYGPWQDLKAALDALGDAYLLTDDPRYAHKAGILLDRLADVYPDYDYWPYGRQGMTFSHGHSNRGKWEGCIWSNWMAQRAMRCYDKVFPGLEQAEGLVLFLQAMKAKYGGKRDKSSLQALHRHIRKDLLDEVVKAVLDCRIRGNEGMSQCTMAIAAIVMDDPVRTPELLDWLFAPRTTDWPKRGSKDQVSGGHLPAIIETKVDRDGLGNEAAPGYSLFWLDYLKDVAAYIHDYDAYDRHDLYRDFPKFREMFLARVRIACLDRWTPQIGDSGGPCRTGRVRWDAAIFAEGFRYTGDPRIARAALLAADGDAKLLRGPIWDADPEGWAGRIEQAAAQVQHGNASRNLTGYGLAILQSPGAETGRALWLYYGRNTGHGHADRLNIGLYYRDMNLITDLGYPEHCTYWPKRFGWTQNTISHNTVVVDRRKQLGSWVGRPVAFLASKGVQFADVSSPDVYKQCSEYRRQCALIDVGADESYVVDVFRVAGGREHCFSFHAAAGEPVRECGPLVKQARGTLAGEDVAFGEFYDGKMRGYKGSGFMYLYDVERGPAGERFALDWPIQDTFHYRRGRGGQVHLRWTMLDPDGELVLAHGDTPYLRHKRPKTLRYGLVFRNGENLRSHFVSVIEPYLDKRNVKSIRRLKVQGPDDSGIAIEVELPRGRTDVVMLAASEDRTYRTETGIEWSGTFAFLRVDKSGVREARLVRGKRLAWAGGELTLPAPAYRGKVVDFDRKATQDNCIYVDADLPTDGSLLGRDIHVATQNERNGSYVIRGVRKAGGRTAVSVGAKSLVCGYRSEKDFSRGRRYILSRGAEFVIPNVATLSR